MVLHPKQCALVITKDLSMNLLGQVPPSSPLKVASQKDRDQKDG